MTPVNRYRDRQEAGQAQRRDAVRGLIYVGGDLFEFFSQELAQVFFVFDYQDAVISVAHE